MTYEKCWTEEVLKLDFFLEGLILSAGKLVPKPGHLYSLNQINFNLLD